MSSLEHVCALMVFGITWIHNAYSVKHTSCGNGWVAYEDNCYLIGRYADPFVEAEHFCRQHSGHLVEPLNTLENNFIKDELRYLKLHCGWVGATDEIAEDTWRWYSSGNQVNFTDWHPTQPGQEVGDEDCCTFWGSLDYQWGDAPCTFKCTPVCKQPGFREDWSEIIG